MLRGVNKKIIEVVDTQNEYFERAIMFVKDRRLAENESEIKRNADDFLKNASGSRLRRMLLRLPLFETLKLLGAAGVGAAVALAVVLL